MQVKIDRSFEKDVRKIKEKSVLKRIANVIRNVQATDDISKVKNLKKLTASDNEYRIRIGVIIPDHKTVIFVRCLHRKDIYKYFPK